MATNSEKKIVLLPNTGVQLIDLQTFGDDQLKRWKATQFAVSRIAVDRLQPRAAANEAAGEAAESELNPFDDDLPPGPEPAEETTALVVAQPKRAIDLAETVTGGWLPLPMSADNALWCMVWVKQQADLKDGVRQYDAVLAVDTRVTATGEGGTIDLRRLPATFSVEVLEPNNFWRSEPVEGFLDRCVAGSDHSGPTLSRGEVQAHLAGLYLFLVELGIPQVHINGLDGHEPVSVTLVVDLGNSRTCGLLVEPDIMERGKQRFKQLELRRLPKRPNEKVSRPFPTRLSFVRPGWGVLEDDRLVRKDGSPLVATFADASVVRIGEEAVDALFASEADFSVRGMGSPKRYLWDGELRPEPWELEPGRPVQGALLSRVKEEDPFTEREPAQPKEARPKKPRYPRKAGILFAFVEIFEHAFRQINSVEHRGAATRRAGFEKRRLIRDVVIMHPAGMHSQEVREFRLGVERAAQLWAEFRTDPVAFRTGKPVPIDATGIPVPRFQLGCDEGFAIQAFYLYGEVIERFYETPERLLAEYGHTVKGEPRLRVASLDIGGGTIDLSIADYTLPPDWQKRATPALNFSRLFHDGISQAGDDVARALLEWCVFPPVIKEMGIDPGAWNELFCPDAGGLDHEWALLRRRLVASLWQPLAHAIIHRAEQGKPVDETIGQLLKTRDNSLEQLNNRLRALPRPGATVESIEDVRIQVNARNVDGAAAREIGGPLTQYSDIVAQFRCDVVIVGGRAAAIPSVRKLIVESFPCPPGAVVFLHELEVGDWFPFAVKGRVGDSKACAVAGAAIAFQSRGLGMGRMSLQEPLGPTKVPNILGVYNVPLSTLKATPTLFAGEVGEADFIFDYTDVVVGARRVDSERAMARPVYQIGLTDQMRGLMDGGPANEGLTICLKREAGSDCVEVGEVRGSLRLYRKGVETRYTDPAQLKLAIRCRLQTMLYSDYWLDSGRFKEVKHDQDADAKGK